MWILIALGLPVLAAVTVIGIYLNKEIVVVFAWLAFGVAGAVLFDPLVGIVAMAGGLMLAAYPTVLQDLGSVLTVSNLLGVVLVIALVSYVLTHRDLSFLVVPQMIVLGIIGILILISTAHADVIFPTMRASQSLGIKGKVVDRTSDMMHDFFTRVIFLMFITAFVRTRRDIRALYATFVLVLFLAVPSALINWWQGNLAMGFRAVASVTAGANANRLAMICLMEVACWWCWLKVRPTGVRWVIAGGAIAGAILVVLATGSRSGLVGCGVLAVLLQTGPRRFRASTLEVGLALAVGTIAVVAVVPPEAWQRMFVFSSNTHVEDTMGERGAASSLAIREDTVEVGLQMIRDHPVLGVGLGNYREVSRQIYLDKTFKPPHNSVIWAASEGGLFVLGGYALFFFLTWRELMMILEIGNRDPSLAYIAPALRVVFYLYCCFSVLADLWLNPITAVLVGVIICMRRYLEGLPAPAPARAALRRSRPVLAMAR
jgi:O-antigen ligase